MSCKIFVFAILFATLAYGTEALAYIETPILMPSDPKAGQFLQIEVRAGICDGFPGFQNSAEVTQSHGKIHMLIPSIHAESDWCNLPLVIVYHFWMGKFPAGKYELSVDRSYVSWFGTVVKPIGSLTFSVTDNPNPALYILATTNGALIVLIACLAGIGAISTRQTMQRRKFPTEE